MVSCGEVIMVIRLVNGFFFFVFVFAGYCFLYACEADKFKWLKVKRFG